MLRDSNTGSPLLTHSGPWPDKVTLSAIGDAALGANNQIRVGWQDRVGARLLLELEERGFAIVRIEK